jgi:hypothetical protein
VAAEEARAEAHQILQGNASEDRSESEKQVSNKNVTIVKNVLSKTPKTPLIKE